MDGFELKVLVRSLLLPPAGPLLLAVAGLLLLRWHRRLAVTLLAVGLGATWALSTWPVAGALASGLEAGLSRFDEAAWRTAAAGPDPPRAIVVLGGGAVVDGPFLPKRERLTSRTVMRLLQGARIARLTGLPVLVSGGTAPWLQTSEAEQMRRAMKEDFGIEVRWVESQSRDTDENARLSARLLKAEGIGSIVLVTHAPHMLRSRLAFEQAGMRVTPAPHEWATGPPEGWRLVDLLPSATAMEASWLLAHEWLGLAWYRLRGHVRS